MIGWSSLFAKGFRTSGKAPRKRTKKTTQSNKYRIHIHLQPFDHTLRYVICTDKPFLGRARILGYVQPTEFPALSRMKLSCSVPDQHYIELLACQRYRGHSSHLKAVQRCQYSYVGAAMMRKHPNREYLRDAQGITAR
jgi:hypothetical protein